MEIKKTYKTKKQDVGKRLDHYLVEKYRGISRSSIQYTISQGVVFVNGRVIKKPGYRLKYPAVISCTLIKKKESPEYVIPQNIPLDIIYEDKDIVVVDKAEGMSVHPGVGNRKGTLLNALLYRYKELKDVGSRDKLGLIHRIDKDTSGIVLVALSNQAHFFFSRQFENREVKKYYIAVVAGNMQKRFGHSNMITLSHYLGRDPINRKKQSVVSKDKGKLATSCMYFISNGFQNDVGHFSFLVIRLVTGRTHQIRVQLSHIGYPIIGDSLYGGKSFERNLLHAYMLRVTMLNGKQHTFVAKIPRIFHQFFERKEFYRIIKQIDNS